MIIEGNAKYVMYVFEYAAVTDCGKIRGNNEDNFFVNGTIKEKTQTLSFAGSGCTSDGYILAAVCDGMGGLDRGEAASMAAVRSLQEYYGRLKAARDKPGWEKDLLRENPEQFISYANECVCSLMDAGSSQTGTTISAVKKMNIYKILKKIFVLEYFALLFYQ